MRKHDVSLYMLDAFMRLKKILPIQFRDDLFDKAYIAGGSIYSLLNDKEVNDYDFFINDAMYAQKIYSYYCHKFKINRKDLETFETNSDGHHFVITENAVTIDKYQIIFKWNGTPKQVISTFDFKHDMSFYYKGKIRFKSNCDEWRTSDCAPSHMYSEHLYYNPDCSRNVIKTIFRVNKFLQRGMKITRSEMSKILLRLRDVGFTDDIIKAIESVEDDDYQKGEQNGNSEPEESWF